MILKVPIKILRGLSEGEDPLYEEFVDYFSKWKDDWETVEFTTNQLTEDQTKAIIKFAENDTENCDKYRALLRRYKNYEKLLKMGDVRELKKLADIPDAFKSFVNKNLPNRLIYTQDEYGRINPYICVNAEYSPGQKDYPSSASMSFEAVRKGQVVSKHITLHNEDLRGLTIAQILDMRDFLPETDELNNLHSGSLEKYALLMRSTGRVAVGSDSGTSIEDYETYYGSRSTRERQFFFKENVSPKVVIDFEGMYLDSSDKDKIKDDKRVYLKLFGENAKLPIHTYGNVFHLEEHIWISMHVDSLQFYQFKGREMMDKLILSEGDKNLIDILMQLSKMKINDIVEGKSGGSFIMATGAPGTGKTLTAEVFSETIEKPLYKVQCSQLGLNVDQVEKNLKTVLAKAARWGAILLIDEADVYVRSRGSDINQNAIVGTFLRTLEYYTGILFMTSNMETEIDDAILSRATAHIKYEAPGAGDRMRIWQILNDQLEVGMSDADLKELTTTFRKAVGRDIKSLLKLGKMYSTGMKVECTKDTIVEISKFVPGVRV